MYLQMENFFICAFLYFYKCDVISMFNNLGVKTKTERGKRDFSRECKAFDIVNALERQLKSKKVIYY